eukprot:2301663-Amphidinium_carterae.1
MCGWRTFVKLPNFGSEESFLLWEDWVVAQCYSNAATRCPPSPFCCTDEPVNASTNSRLSTPPNRNA